MKAPAGYVAGLGRGASGFTTRSDIGPAREATEEDADDETGAKDAPVEEEALGQFDDPDNEVGLFAGGTYEADDAEADSIFAAVDSRMDARRGRQRAERAAAAAANTPDTVQSQFADLKRGLAQMSEDEWATLPEVANLVGNRAKKPRLEGRSYVVPDSVILGAQQQTELSSSVVDGTESEAPAALNFAELGQAREKMLSIQLDASDARDGSASVDASGYLTSLQSQVFRSDAEIGDIKRARALLQSLIRTNPKHAPGWVAAAWLENVAGRTVQARKLIAQGCAQCPNAEDVWLAASELNTRPNARVVLADAITHLPQSVRLWLRAAELEQDTQSKIRVLRKALEHVPGAVRLWKELVQLHDSADDARVLLARAVDVIPHATELWLALARLETPARARQVLNRARRVVPTSAEIWIAAARLQEQEGSAAQVDALLVTAVAALRRAGAALSREEWLSHAERAERQGAPVTSQAIVRATVALGLDPDDQLDTWLDDAALFVEKGCVGCARAVYAYALNVEPEDVTLWRRAADLERAHGTPDALRALLAQAVAKLPSSQVLWLMYAKETWVQGDVPGARAILNDAFEANPESDAIWLAAAKLEAENGNTEAARQLLERARTISGTDRIWMKAAVFERDAHNDKLAIDIAREGLAKFPSFDKLQLVYVQLLQAHLGDGAAGAATLGITSAAPGAASTHGNPNAPPQTSPKALRDAFVAALKHCPTCTPLWIANARFEEAYGTRMKARSILERGRTLNPTSDELWLESILVEERSGSGAFKRLLATALQHAPTSGLLHAYHVWCEPRPTRKARAVDALKRTNNAPCVIVTVARLFWYERKLEKAREWFGKAIAADADYGDAYAWFYKFEKQHGSEEQLKSLVDQATAANPRHGLRWQPIIKNPQHSAWTTVQSLEYLASQYEDSDKY